MFWYKIRIEMDQKGHIIDQKGQKMNEKGQKIEFWEMKYLFFSGILHNGIGGTLLPPLTKNHSAQKKLSGIGGCPPLTKKIR